MCIRDRDINSLFLDTGIGSNSYAIIALGMVDDILSDKENSVSYTHLTLPTSDLV